MFERKPIRVYHYDGVGGAHDIAHKGAEHAKAALDEFSILPPIPLVIMGMGQSLVLYDGFLHTILKTAGSVAHPQRI